MHSTCTKKGKVAQQTIHNWGWGTTLSQFSRYVASAAARLVARCFVVATVILVAAMMLFAAVLH